MAREKVCIVAPHYSTAGGMRTIVRQLIKILSENYGVIMLSIKWREEEKRRFVHYDIALNPRLRMLFIPWQIPTIVLYELSGAIWCFILRILGVQKFLVQEAVVTAFFVTLVGKMTGARVYMFDYGPMLSLYDPSFVRTPSRYRPGFVTVIYAKLLRAMNKFSLRHCSKFFIYSREIEKCALDRGLESEKMVPYNFPVDTTLFRRYDLDEREKVREKFSVRESEVVVTFIGRISEDKGLPYLLESAKVLIKRYAGRVKFIIAGDGPLVDWLLKNTMEYRTSHIVYLGALHGSKEIVDILNASDVFVYPITVSYGYALAFLEAMATGLPSIITDVGPTKELIVNEYNGMVIPTNDVRALRNALERLILDKKLRKRMGENAKKVLTKFSTETYQKVVLASISE